MDTENGNFKMIEPQDLESMMNQKPGKIFSVGEIVKIKESRFRIKKITPKQMILRLLPKE